MARLRLLSVIKKDWGFEDNRLARNLIFMRCNVPNWAKWPERESDHKTLYNLEITSRAIILSLYVVC
jgi:hypothetical protein